MCADPWISSKATIVDWRPRLRESWLPLTVFFGWALWILCLARKTHFKSTGKGCVVCHTTAHDLGPWFRLHTGVFCLALRTSSFTLYSFINVRMLRVHPSQYDRWGFPLRSTILGKSKWANLTLLCFFRVGQKPTRIRISNTMDFFFSHKSKIIG